MPPALSGTAFRWTASQEPKIREINNPARRDDQMILCPGSKVSTLEKRSYLRVNQFRDVRERPQLLELGKDDGRFKLRLDGADICLLWRRRNLHSGDVRHSNNLCTLRLRRNQNEPFGRFSGRLNLKRLLGWSRRIGQRSRRDRRESRKYCGHRG